MFAASSHERAFGAAVQAARVLSRTSSVVTMPNTIEVPIDRPTLIAANHSSLFDLVASLVVLGNYGIPARIGVNKRFFANPLAGAFLRGIGCIPFAKGEAEVAEEAMVDALIDGQAAAIMPEGRITRPEDQTNGVGPGRPGVSRIARRAGAAVIPVGFAHANVAWAPGTTLPKVRFGRHHVVASVGAPIVFDTDDHVANAEQVMAAIGELVLSGRGTER